MPGQPFYLRQLVYTRVKQYMVDKGVRLNDFSIVERSNNYFDKESKGKEKEDKDSSSLSALSSSSSKHNTATDSTTKVKYSKAELSLPSAHMHIQYGLTAWFAFCSTIGLASFALLDQWITVSLGRRIYRKYIVRKE